MITFPDLIQSVVLRKNLARLAFKEPTPVQAASIPPAVLGRDVVATAQTGTGKTLAFSLPILEALGKVQLEKTPLALILSPTRELALQIEEAFNRVALNTGVRTACVVGGMSESKQLQAIRKGAHVIIATPGRLCDFLDRNLISMSSISIVVLDEADRMLDMGFLPSVERILKGMPTARQTLFFSATFDNAAERLISRYTKNPERVAIGSTSQPVDKIDLHLYECEPNEKLGLLKHLMTASRGSFLVFSRTKHGAERLAKKVSAEGFKATAIHGDRSQNQRNQALKGFQEGYYRVLVATDVAARGIHVDGIEHVVNYDLPQTPEDFVHRVGRTGRAGAVGVASTFSTVPERSDIRAIERNLKARLVQKDVPDGISIEDKKSTPVIVMPKRGGAYAGRPANANAFKGASKTSFRPGRRRSGTTGR